MRAQAEALRSLPGLEVDLLEFEPGRANLAAGVSKIRKRLRAGGGVDLVHAHYGLTGLAARLAGASPLVVTFHGTDVRHPTVGALSRRLARRVALSAAVSRSLFGPGAEGRPGLPPCRGRAVLPCGADLARFGPAARSDARAALGLDPHGRYLFFPADPGRAVKRHERAARVAEAVNAQLIVAKGIEPEQMPDRFNAASATLVTSDDEGFGLAAVESLACGVPVISTPVGIAPSLLAGLDGCAALPFSVEPWADLAASHLDAEDPRVEGGPEAASRYSAARMAERVAVAYEAIP